MTVEIGAQERGKYEELRHLSDTYQQVQKIRIGNSNRVYASSEGEDTNEPDPFLSGMVEKLEAIERDIFRQMKRVVKHHPAWPWLDGVKGMGPTLSTKILGLIGDIEKFETVSRLWSFGGYGLHEGRIQRPVKGEKLSYNRRLKTALYLAGDSFIKSRSPYRDIYDEAKAYYRRVKQLVPLTEMLPDREIPDREIDKKGWDALIREANKLAGAKNDEAVWSDGHVDNAARRKMVKLFVSHLYVVWREAEGLSVDDPYVIASPDHPEHTHRINPWEFSG